MRIRYGFFLGAASLLLLIPGGVRAADWPMWRYDANRSGSSPAELPAKLYLQWVREYTPLKPAWPARGAPVIADGKVYFAASIWPFMGIFIHALDARTGEPHWTNDGDGSTYMKQPHNADAFASIAPQGPLVVIGNRLLLPGGRSVPAAFDRRTGKMNRLPL